MRKPLPSWTDGPTSEAIVRFVRRVTNPASPMYVPPDERVAVFDSDGTLWCEQPASALAYFVMHRLRLCSAEDLPSDDAPLVQAAQRDDIEIFRALDLHRLSEVLLQANVGLTPEQFVAEAHEFLAQTVHPRFGFRLRDLTFRPMLELLAYLEAKSFRTFIVTGGGVELVRAASELLYGVPTERVAGATVDYRFERMDGKILVIRTRTLLGEPGEGEAKVRAIQHRIGRRPILAAGNSVGDREMLEYTSSGRQPSICLIIEHDDAEREYAYVSDSKRLSELAARNHWLTVSMRRDFRRIFDRLPRHSAVAGAGGISRQM
ncbi:MAG: haloacid dehalogenase-like hydrolase [Chloroflexi bacterium]|nr:haloacid dehalogenase-like hydrolase [Chloroflexota bacterium]